MSDINQKLESIKSEFIESNAYAAEKGKGLATKEDIGEITRTVEQVKSNIAMNLELIKLELGKKATIHRLAPEKEFEALTDIGRFLYELQLATMALRPLGIQRVPLDETEEQSRRNISDAMKNGPRAMMLSWRQPKKANYSCLTISIYSSSTLDDCPLSKLTISEPLLLMEGGKLPPSTFEQAEQNIAEMSGAIEAAIASIRQQYGIE